jgi:hypothetical protein
MRVNGFIVGEQAVFDGENPKPIEMEGFVPAKKIF